LPLSLKGQPGPANIVRFHARMAKGMNELAPRESGGEFLLYQIEDGHIRIQTRMQEETVWLTQDQMAQLFGKAKSTNYYNL